MIISPSPLYRARRELEVYWRKCKALPGGSNINDLGTIVALQNFLEGFYNVVDPDKVTEIFTFRKNQNTGTGTTLYGMLGKSTGTLEGTAAWRADNNGINLPTDSAAISATGISLSYAPCSIIVVTRVNQEGSRCRYGHTGGGNNGYYMHQGMWGTGHTRAFAASKDPGIDALFTPNPPGDDFIPLTPPNFHYAMMSITAAKEATLNRDGAEEWPANWVNAGWAQPIVFNAPFYLAKILAGTPTLNDDIAFIGILTQDLTGKMASIKNLMATTICQGLP